MKDNKTIQSMKVEDMNEEEMLKAFEINACNVCPTCEKRGVECTEYLIETLRKTTLLFTCEKCKLIWGRYEE